MRRLILITGTVLTLTTTALAENYCTMQVPGYNPGVYDTFSTELTTGTYSIASGTIYYTYSGVNKFSVNSGSGSFQSATNETRYGVAQGALQLFQSLITPNYFTIASSSTTCPTSQNYNWLMVRSRTPEVAMKPMDASSGGFPVAGVASYNSTTGAFTSSALYNYTTTVSSTFDSLAFTNVDPYNYSYCLNGAQKLKVRSGQSTRVWDTLGSIYFDTDRFLYQSTGGNPVAIIGATPQDLDGAAMDDLAKNVLSGIYTDFLTGNSQNRKNLLGFITHTGGNTTISLEEPADIDMPTGDRTIFGNIVCPDANLDTPAQGFCRGTFTKQASGLSAAAVCLFSTTSSNSNGLVACSMRNPDATTKMSSYIGNVNSRAKLAVTVNPATAPVSGIAYAGVLLENLSGRNIPYMGYPSSTSDRLEAYSVASNATAQPFKDYYSDGTGRTSPLTGIDIYSGGTSMFNVSATAANCGGSLPSWDGTTPAACGTSLAAYSKCQMCVKYEPGATLSGSHLKLFKVAYDNGSGSAVNASAYLVGSVSGSGTPSPPEVYVVSEIAYNQATTPIIKVMARYADGTIQDVTTAASWSISDASKMSISSSGVASFTGTGSVDITACLGAYVPATSGSGTVCAGTESVTKSLDIYAQQAFADVGQRLIGQTNFTTAGGQNAGGMSAHSISSANSVIWSDGKNLLFADAGNRRIMIWNGLPTTDNENADIILGQNASGWQVTNNATGDTTVKQRFTGTISTGATGIYSVRIDYGNNSNVTYQYNSATTNTTTIAAGLAAAIDADANLVATSSTNVITVIAANTGFGFSMTSTGANTVASITGSIANSGGTVITNGASKTGLNVPKGVWSDGTRIAVADSTNNRVLIWTSWPTSNGQAPDIVLGQPSFNCGVANAGTSACSAGGVSAQSLSGPLHAYFDGIRFYVADAGNYRVLIWNSFPTSNQQAANLVLGQSGLTTAVSNCDATCSGSNAAGTTRLDSFTNVGFIASDGEKLFISDFYRVLGWSTPPLSNRAPADIVLGQPTGLHSYGNSPVNPANGTALGYSSEYAFNSIGSVGMPLSWDGQRLFVSDPGGARVLSFNDLQKIPYVVVPTVANSTTYTLQVDGIDYKYTSDANATITEIVTGLANQLNGDRASNAMSIFHIQPTSYNSTVYKINLDGTDYSYTSDSSATISEIVSGLISAVNGASAAPARAKGTTSVMLIPKTEILPIAVNSATYRVTIDGTAYAMTADSSATATEIVTGLKTAINNDGSCKAKASGSATLYLEPKVDGNEFNVTLGTNLADYEIVPTAANSTAYAVTINGVLFQITSDSSATALEISTALRNAINADGGCKATATLNGNNLLLSPKATDDTYTVQVGQRLAYNNGTFNLNASAYTIVPTAVNSYAYKITIDGVDYNFTADSSANATEVTTGLKNAINADSNCKASASGTTTVVLAPKVAGNMYNVTVGGNLTIPPSNSIGTRMIVTRKYANTAVSVSESDSNLVAHRAFGAADRVYGQPDFTCTKANSTGAGPTCAVGANPAADRLGGPRGVWSDGADVLWISDNSTNFRLITMQASEWIGGGYASLSITGGSPFNFGTIAPGATKEKLFVVTNTGNMPASYLSGSTVSGTGYSYKSATAPYTGGTFPGHGGTCPIPPVQLLPGQSCLVNIIFAPPSNTTPLPTDFNSGSFYITYRTGQGTTTADTNTMALNGTANLATISLSPSSKNYGSVSSGSTSDQVFILSNSAAMTATGLGPSNGTPLQAPFKFKNSAWPGSSTFTGTSSNGSTSITGVNSIAGLAPGLAVSGPGISSGTTIVSAASTTVVLSQAAGAGAGAGTFNGSGTCSGSLAASFTFTGTSANASTTISGASSTTGLSNGLIVTGPGIQSGTTIVSTSGSNVTISQAASTGFGAGTFTVHGTCRVVVQYAPTGSGSFSETLQMNYFDGKNNQSTSATLSGTAP